MENRTAELILCVIVFFVIGTIFVGIDGWGVFALVPAFIVSVSLYDYMGKKNK